MNVHENVMVDLLGVVRAGQASVETRQLVDAYLAEHPKLQRFAGLGAPPDAALEKKTLETIRKSLRRATWEKAFALMFSVLPFAFVFDGSDVRFVFAGHPGLIVGMVVTALAFWARYYRFSRRACGL